MKKPSFPMEVAVFLIDTSEFKNETLGFYTRLILTQWENKDLPQDPESLCSIGKCTPEEFERLWPLVKHKFIPLENGRMINQKTEECRQKKERFLFFTSAAGESSAASKKAKGKKVEIIYPWPSVAFKEKWEFWKKYKKESWRFSYKTAVSEQGALNALKKLTDDEKQAIELIDNAINRQWQGIYVPPGFKPIKNVKTKKSFGSL